MKRTFEFDDIAALDASLKNLRRYNQAMYISVDEKFLDNDLAEQYFNAEEGSEQELAFERMIGAAAILACNVNPDIPQEYKLKVGNRMQRESLSAYRAAKVDFLYYSGRLGVPIKAETEREKRHKEIAIVGKTHYLKKATKIIKKRSIHLAEREGIKSLIGELTDSKPIIKWTTRGIMWATSLIPDRVKNEVKEKGKEVFEKTANIIEKNVERFTKTPFGSKVENVMKTKVAPIVERGVQKVAIACSTVKQKFKSSWTKFKSVLDHLDGKK